MEPPTHLAYDAWYDDYEDEVEVEEEEEEEFVDYDAGELVDAEGVSNDDLVAQVEASKRRQNDIPPRWYQLVKGELEINDRYPLYEDVGARHGGVGGEDATDVVVFTNQTPILSWTRPRSMVLDTALLDAMEDVAADDDVDVEPTDRSSVTVPTLKHALALAAFGGVYYALCDDEDHSTEEYMRRVSEGATVSTRREQHPLSMEEFCALPTDDVIFPPWDKATKLWRNNETRRHLCQCVMRRLFEQDAEAVAFLRELTSTNGLSQRVVFYYVNEEETAVNDTANDTDPYTLQVNEANSIAFWGIAAGAAALESIGDMHADVHGGDRTFSRNVLGGLWTWLARAVKTSSPPCR